MCGQIVCADCSSERRAIFVRKKGKRAKAPSGNLKRICDHCVELEAREEAAGEEGGEAGERGSLAPGGARDDASGAVVQLSGGGSSKGLTSVVARPCAHPGCAEIFRRAGTNFCPRHRGTRGGDAAASAPSPAQSFFSSVMSPLLLGSGGPSASAAGGGGPAAPGLPPAISEKAAALLGVAPSAAAPANGSSSRGGGAADPADAADAPPELPLLNVMAEVRDVA
jgi:hypothetical protein